MTPVQAIRAKCLDCCCFSAKEVRLCPLVSCSLYPFRLGKNPNCKSRAKDIGKTAEEEKEHSYLCNSEQGKENSTHDE